MLLLYIPTNFAVKALVEGRANDSLLAPLSPGLAEDLQQECARELEALRLFSADLQAWLGASPCFLRLRLQKEAVVLAALFDRLEVRLLYQQPSYVL